MVEVSILASIGGAVVTAALGSLGTYIARERSRKKREAEEIQNLRRSLLAELASMDELAIQKPSNYTDHLPAHSTLSAEVYQSNAADISLLNSDEADAVIRFYASALKIDGTLDTVGDFLKDAEHPQMHDMTGLNESIDLLRDEWKQCVLALLSELDGYPNKVRVEGEIIQVDKSISTADLWFVLNAEQIDTADIKIGFID